MEDRLYEAILEVVCAKGFEQAEVDEILDRADVERAEFDRLYGSKEECAAAAMERLLGAVESYVRDAFDRGGEWPRSMRCAAYAAADWIREHPHEVRFGILETLWGNEMTQARRERGFRAFADLVDAGRSVAPDPDSVPAFTAEAVIGSIAEMTTKRLRHASRADPADFIPQLMYLAVLPYLGEEAAQRELRMPRPHPDIVQP
ncbi:MAG TPA: TetR/AcrR family transcriptional regulator [Solirubrobacterales bacterium]|nr:TetR/AcrR family transcriptional regulator [Solirubrobacterales bacterium]